MTASPAKRLYIRPWALAAPIAILLLSLPLLRPLRHPLDLSRQESVRLAAARQRVEQQQVNLREPMPVFSFLLTGPYWLLHRCGVTFEGNGALVTYLMTLIGVTIPVAASAGLIYRMARLFELTRPLRSALSLIVIVGSGLFSYATVLNPHAPAAFLVPCSGRSRVSDARRRSRQTLA
jgi:hypothetical protein